ncbi:hypothetical protein F3Y22_tig00110562pilonHSYRG00061 [Hibiscus syriacus]|uniref:Uncharacterized protein n=1 Tax=Hibiscus syriacus TaxID=106335 RepID=A0A6A3A870_HIBSY|nr:ribonuclease 3-like [Hibiscus syriacus]KAE8700083.1 hypothetical protein F3Y22_tig00110562pilonHSYRG00061 [Hibiscus syriacus]
MFTIHGIWPQDINDQPIDPYSKFPQCTRTTPPLAQMIMPSLTPILQDMHYLWPNLKNPTDTQAKEIFWEHEWDAQGKCSAYPMDPLRYFESGLRLTQNLPNPDFSLQSTRFYTVQDILNKVRQDVHFGAEISCNRNRTGTVQLFEIHLCYEKPTPPELIHKMRDCPHPTRGRCPNLFDNVYVP